MAVLVRYHTPHVYRAVVAWYYLVPGVAVFLAGAEREGNLRVNPAQDAPAHRIAAVNLLRRSSTSFRPSRVTAAADRA